MDDIPFLRAIFSTPDDLPRLVYADWLEERGDPRAEFLRLELEHHRTPVTEKARQTALAMRMNEIRTGLDSGWSGAIWSARHLPAGGRLDVAFVSDGKGLIEVRSGPGETLLLVEGKPVALNWDDCQGSVGQYLVFTGHTRGNEYGQQLREIVEGEGNWSQPLTDQIWPLLSLFTSGAFTLVYTPSAAAERYTTFEYADTTRADQSLINYYPAEIRNLVCTQAPQSLNQDRVAYFREQIRSGRSPILLTASAGSAWCEFVIDGHHKLAAYETEGVRPAILSIVCWNANGVSLADGLGCMSGGHPGIREYRRMKRPPRKR